MATKPHINLIIIGHVDHGKSTLMGHLVYVTGALTKQEMLKLEKLASETKDASFKFAYTSYHTI